MVSARLIQFRLCLDVADAVRSILYWTGSIHSRACTQRALLPTFFTFIASFCGVVVPYPALPHFWQSWMYWLTPFHYLLEGLVGVITHNVPVRCIDREESRFSTPAGMNCQDYAGSFAEKAGGYVRDAGNGMCSFCQYSTGNQYVSCIMIIFV